MSYDIYIGEAVISRPDLDEHNALSISTASVIQNDAPTFPNDEMTGNGNGRHPGYSQWLDFCRTVGLYELFFDKDQGLMRQHPGTFLLRRCDRDRVRVALARWRDAHPGAVPGFGDRDYYDEEIARWSDRISILTEEPEKANHAAEVLQRLRINRDGLPPNGAYDSVLARLIWLDWWMTWALDKCFLPAIHNH